MIELTGDEIVNTLVMERQLDERRAVVVEGQEDFQLLELHLNESVAYLQFAGSKNAVLKAAELCVSDGIDWVIFVVDADFDRLTGTVEEYSSNVIASENYDLLMDVIEVDNRLVSKSIITLAPPNTERQIRERFGIDSLGIAQRLAAPVGALRYLTVAGEFGISVRGWPFTGLANAHLTNTVNRVISLHAVDRSGGRVEASVVERRIYELLASPPVSDFRLISSHDLAAAIAELVKFQSGRALGHDWICASIRVALSREDFMRLAVVRKLCDWANVAGVSIFASEKDIA